MQASQQSFPPTQVLEVPLVQLGTSTPSGAGEIQASGVGAAQVSLEALDEEEHAWIADMAGSDPEAQQEMWHQVRRFHRHRAADPYARSGAQ